MRSNRRKILAILLVAALGSLAGCRKDVLAPDDGQICTIVDGVLVCVP